MEEVISFLGPLLSVMVKVLDLLPQGCKFQHWDQFHMHVNDFIVSLSDYCTNLACDYIHTIAPTSSSMRSDDDYSVVTG